MGTAGAVSSSSKFLSRQMTSHLNPATDLVVVELGPGDGAITEHILARLAPEARLIAFEINEKFCESLRSRFGQDERFILIEDSAEHIEDHLQMLGFGKADAIVSAIPFVMVPEDMRNRILASCKTALKAGGWFVQFHYSLLLKDTYKKLFKKVDVEFVFINMPPAFVFSCQ
jgi:phospholipid N-methyltransferase